MQGRKTHMLHCDEIMLLNSIVDCKMDQRVLAFRKTLRIGGIDVISHEISSLYFVSRTQTSL